MTVAGKRYVDCTIFERESIMSTEAAEDSSYDSDYDAEETISSTAIHSLVDKSNHSDVSRTTSDTLAAEFAEYVTIQSKTPSSQNSDYIAKVEFAKKMGYTERMVQITLEKLDSNSDQNELLAELISLEASSSLNDELNYKYKNNKNNNNNGSKILNDNYDKTIASSCSNNVLRPIVIDGSNVAMSHGNKEIFSCRGIKICVDWFRSRGHNEITVFVPKWRKETSRSDNPIAEQEILVELERDRILVFTPSRFVGGKRMVCYDDRYILRLAVELNGIVVSNDNYRDLSQENIEFRRVVEERILMYSFVNDIFMPPDDPLGRSGPTLDNFLRINIYNKNNDLTLPPICPYAKKCTYGNKCKFWHPEKGLYTQKNNKEKLIENAKKHLQTKSNINNLSKGLNYKHKTLSRTKSSTQSSGICKSLNVSKSKSVENVTDGISYPIIYQKIPQTQNIQVPIGWQASRVNNNIETEPVNIHKKLQRQLTLNPACDPRLYQLRKFHQQHQTSMNSSSNNLQHPPLIQHTSNENYPLQLSWELAGHHHHHHQQHQHVTRIASAPDSYCAWPPQTTNPTISLGGQRLGTSDPQLNTLQSSPTTTTTTTTTTTIVNNHHDVNWNISQTHDARRRIHYHLANIFPEEQVQTVMTLNPHETDPKKICALILIMFPKS